MPNGKGAKNELRNRRAPRQTFKKKNEQEAALELGALLQHNTYVKLSNFNLTKKIRIFTENYLLISILYNISVANFGFDECYNFCYLKKTIKRATLKYFYPGVGNTGIILLICR